MANARHSYKSVIFVLVILQANFLYFGWNYFNNLLSKRSSEDHPDSDLILCPVPPPDLKGALVLDLVAPQSLEVITTRLSKSANFINLQKGGHYKPAQCKSRDKVAILVPYLNRPKNLLILLNHLIPMLMTQLIEYRLFVVEPANQTQTFNKGILFNAGVIEILKMDRFDCIIFQDVDLLPENDKNLYNCPSEPRHMSVALDYNNYTLHYARAFGGVTALTTAHFMQLNGYSNAYWGWGAEDDDMANRLEYHKLNIARRSPNIARYTAIKHPEEKHNPDGLKLLLSGSHRFHSDGLSNVNYTLDSVVLERLYTLIRVQFVRP